MNLHIKDGSIWSDQSGKLSSASVLDLWNAKKSMPEEYAEIRILGLANPQLFVDIDVNGFPRFSVLAKSDSETFDLGNKRPTNSTYFVSSNVVVPLREQSFIELFIALEEMQNLEDTNSPENVANSLLKIANELGITIDFSEAFYACLESKPAKLIESPTSTPLWSYQELGFSWMYRLWELGLGGILGDEMGVGKTLQLLALACKVSTDQFNKPAMVVVPSNLLLKWCKDFVQFAPNFVEKVYVHSGSDRNKDPRFLRNQRIILTTYSMLVEDDSIFGLIDFSVICCDEAHELKEYRTQKSKAISGLNAESIFLATGTPIQNRLMDYWTLIEIIEPGLLGSREAFELRGENTPSEARKLMDLTKHRILRRTQEQVDIDIPEGVEIYVPLELSLDLFQEYVDIKNGISSSSNGLTGRGALQIRRQYCAHPGVFLEESIPNLGTKSTYLLNELDKIYEMSEKAVIFVADFNKPRDLYLELINNEYPDVWTGVIDGRTPLDLRHVLLERFTDHSGTAILLVNPTVGGQGLDMVAANHVFHMNPAWNPAKTDQATFRVTRPGQTKKTRSHHLYYVETLEENIYDLVLRKRELSDAALQQAENESEYNQYSVRSIFGNMKRGSEND